jgi:hypothetical protein
MRRRELLSGIALLGSGAALAKPRGETAKPAALPADLSDWESVRRQFPLDYRYLQMSQFFLASHPQPVRAAIEAHRRALDENPFLYVEENIGRLERATRDAAAAHLACKPDDLAMTDSTTMGLGTSSRRPRAGRPRAPTSAASTACGGRGRSFRRPRR